MLKFLRSKQKGKNRAEAYLSEGVSSRGASPQASPVRAIDPSDPQFQDYDSDAESDDSCQRGKAVHNASPCAESVPVSSRISVQGVTPALPALRSGVVVLGSDGSPTLVTGKLGSPLQPPRSSATFFTDDFPGGGESSATTFKKRLSTLAQPLEMVSTPPPTTAQLVMSEFAQSSSPKPVPPAQPLSARNTSLHR